MSILSIYLSIYTIYIAPLQGNYSEALPARAKRMDVYCIGRWGETDPVRNFWFYDTINVQQGLSFFSTYSPQSHTALDYTILSAKLLGEERFLINYFWPNGPSCPDMGQDGSQKSILDVNLLLMKA